MYAARDVTSTVGCIGLIVSSIISKKVAEGIRHLVLDIKWGQGCYQDTQEQAEKLAEVLVQTSRNVGVNTVAVISHMESPLGRCEQMFLSTLSQIFLSPGVWGTVSRLRRVWSVSEARPVEVPVTSVSSW